jgi:electron transport complex protein RnfE
MTDAREGVASTRTAALGAPFPQIMFLGLCPLLATGTTLLSGACLGAAAAIMLCGSASCLLVCRRFVPASAPMIFLLLLTAGWVSVIDLSLQYWWFPLRQGLGIYVPLMAANCLLLSTLEERMLRGGGGAAFGETCRVAGWVLVCVAAAGGLRELAATGVLLGDAGLLGLRSPFAAGGSGLAVLRAPAGAFLALGLLAALLQFIYRRRPVA